MGGCPNPMFLLMDNSDYPSTVEQLQQDVILIVIPLLVIVPSSMMCLMPYASQLAFCSMGISNYASCPDSVTLHSLCPLLSFPLSLGFCSPFYSGCFLVQPWDSLSDYVYPGIACLAFQASDWVGAFWGSLSGLLISHLC